MINSNKNEHFSLANPEDRDIFGMIISYTAKVKLYLGAMGGEVTAELPLVLMHPKVRYSFLLILINLTFE